MNTETLLSISKWILYIGIIMGAFGSIGVPYFTAKLDKTKDQKIDSLLNGNQRLEQGNRDLSLKIDVYQENLSAKQKEIDKLQFEVDRSKRGLVSLWDFNGGHREGSAGSMKLTVGIEVNIFQELARLEQEKKFDDIIAVATKQIAKTPDWLTPYLFRGVAYTNLGELQKAANDFRYVIKMAVGDPKYAQAQTLLDQIEQQLK
jgi:tetratricopeptide (TPR) repeat protein